jgi:Ca-activated chloride channel homolog
MRAMLALYVGLVGCGGKAPHESPITKAQGGNGEIITAAIQKMNGAEFGKPSQQWRTGHTSPIAPPQPVKTATGFHVAFASAATITTPTVYDRKVIVSGGFHSKELYAFEAKTGKPLWAIDLGDDGPSSPACEDNTCVVNTESCTIFAVEASTGKLLWSYWLGDPLTSAPTIANGVVFASYPTRASDGKPAPENASHALAAFDLKTGKVLWQLWLDSDVMSAPVASGEFVYVGTFAGTVIKVEQKTGAIRYAMRAAATSAPVVRFENNVEQLYYTHGEYWKDELGNYRKKESMRRADHNDPEPTWESDAKPADYIDANVQKKSDYAKSSTVQDSSNGFSGGAPLQSNYMAAFGNVGVANVSSMQAFQGSRVVSLRDRNVSTMGDEVIATSNATGKMMWKHKLSGDLVNGGFLGTAPLAVRGSILLGTLEGHVLRLDANSGKELARYKAGGPIRSQPVVADGWIYVGTEDGKLVAIDTGDPKVTGWPTWGGNPQRTGIVD